MIDGLPEDWKILRKWLPEGQQLACMAREHGFLTRVKGVRDMEVWLRLLLMHAGGLSLEQTVQRAADLGLPKISSIALHKRLLKAAGWLEAITKYLLASRSAGHMPAHDALYERLVAVDATDLQRPAGEGGDWRVYYSVNLSNLRCEQLELTDKDGDEMLKHFKFERGQIVLSGKGFCQRAQVAHVIESGADIVVRHRPDNFPLLGNNGMPLDVLGWLRTLLPRHRSNECKVWFEHEGKKHPLRLCAVRMGKLAAQKALNRVRRKAQKQGSQPQPQTEEMSGYIMVLTTLDAQGHACAAVLGVYRCRWQAELVFKRLKSLLGMGELRKQNEASARAWVQAKIVTALLAERALMEARLFPPRSCEQPKSEPVAAV